MCNLASTKSNIMYKSDIKVNNAINSFLCCHVNVNHTKSTSLNRTAIFTEDSSSGYLFFYEFLKRCYSHADIDLISVNGHGNIKYIPKYIENSDIKYDNIIIIYDRGRSSGQGSMSGSLTDNNRKDIPKTIRKLKEITSSKVFIYSPIAFESIALSFEYLLTDFLKNYNINLSESTQLHLDLIKLVTGEIEDINWFNYVREGKSVEYAVEEAIEKITQNTVYQITHSGKSHISTCWYTNCCENNEQKPKCNITDLNKYKVVNPEKLEVIAAHSILGGLTYIMDKIYGIKDRTYPNVVYNSNYKNKLMLEG